MASRFEYFLVSHRYQRAGSGIMSNPFSDHYSPYVDLKISDLARGLIRWALDWSLLTEEDWVSNMRLALMEQYKEIKVQP
ncbi:hypothetical protein NDU88_005943 [Pleurodeles waltl]|uniref:Uncharacterized protein n=1 Tax=Pleurodeles waltl TaxID=8319 RepID=A0AAV7NQI9_PLEWA|nr:hypothetical protein NDU88_005943 [Pleurodeles waltl]